jgi:hypothetical protein
MQPGGAACRAGAKGCQPTAPVCQAVGEVGADHCCRHVGGRSQGECCSMSGGSGGLFQSLRSKRLRKPWSHPERWQQWRLAAVVTQTWANTSCQQYMYAYRMLYDVKKINFRHTYGAY